MPESIPVAKFVPDQDLDEWEIVAPQRRVVKAGDGIFHVYLHGDGEKALGIPIELPLASFNRARLTMVVPDENSVRLRFPRDEESSMLVTPFKPFGFDKEERHVDFLFPRTLLRRGATTRCWIEFNREPPRFGFLSLELFFDPLARLFPEPDAPGFASLGQDRRHGVGLDRGRPLSTRLEVPAGGVFEFWHGLPDYLDPLADDLQVVLELTGAAGTSRQHTFGREQGSAPWQRERVELGELRGQQVDLQLSLRTGDQIDHAIVAIAGAGLLPEPQEDPMTVLLVTSDTHRADHIGSHPGGVEVRTPVLDALGERGILFENCFTSINNTNPSHAALMTGTHPRDTGIFNNNTPLVEEATTLAEEFRARGFATYASISARHLFHSNSGLGQGFDRMSSPDLGQREGGESVDMMRSWLDDADGRPLFLWLHVFDAHVPYAPPDDLRDEYYPPDRDPFDPNSDALPPSQVPPDMKGLTDLDYPAQMYRAEISYLDRELKKVLDFPRVAEGLILVTSDHGESLGAHGVYWEHEGIYPDTIHVPLLLAGPGVPRGRRIEAPVRQIDAGRTLLELAGVQDIGFPGRNLLEEQDLDEARFAIEAHLLSASIQWNQWYLIFHIQERELPFHNVGERHRVELYDRSNDPACLHDVAPTNRDIARRLRGRLTRWLADSAPQKLAGEASSDPRTMQDLAQLGYVDHGGSDTPFELDCDCKHCQEYQ